MIEAGAEEDVARFTLDCIGRYYGRATTPHAGDRMEDDVAIDPEDLEGFVEIFFHDNGMPMPKRDDPEVLPDYREVTLTSFAVYLTQRRPTLLGRERIEA